MADFVDYIPMRLNDPDLKPWDGRSSRVDPGTYDFQIVKVGFDQSRKGNRTLVVTGTIVSEDSPMKGRQMRNWYVISDDEFARGRMKALTDATGAVLDDQGGFTAESLVGLRFTADVIEDTYEEIDTKTGQMASRVRTKWIGERPMDGQPVVETAPKPAATKPTSAPAGRRPLPPNGGAQARR